MNVEHVGGTVPPPSQSSVLLLLLEFCTAGRHLRVRVVILRKINV